VTIAVGLDEAVVWFAAIPLLAWASVGVGAAQAAAPGVQIRALTRYPGSARSRGRRQSRGRARTSNCEPQPAISRLVAAVDPAVWAAAVQIATGPLVRHDRAKTAHRGRHAAVCRRARTAGPEQRRDRHRARQHRAARPWDCARLPHLDRRHVDAVSPSPAPPSWAFTASGATRATHSAYALARCRVEALDRWWSL
jgi:hypothetical protein